MEAAPEEVFWQKELKAFKAYSCESFPCTYRDWQPTKWQSLERISDILGRLCTDVDKPTALELGCGSAILLIQLAFRGFHTIGIDLCSSALSLANEAIESLGLKSRPTLIHGDFFDTRVREQILPVDVVLSSGLIEHFFGEKQQEVFDLHCSLSRRFVLIGVPNLESPIFRSFIEWARRSGRLYDEEHFPIDIEALAERRNVRLVTQEGCHLFFGKSEYYIPGDGELEAFYKKVATMLSIEGGDHYRTFPRLDFTSRDIPALKAVEERVDPFERLKFGFMKFYIVDTRSEFSRS